MPVITELTRAERALQIDDALATVRMEGLEPSAEALRIYQRYVDGELTSGEMDLALDEYIDREYGPVRLPRDERS